MIYYKKIIFNFKINIKNILKNILKIKIYNFLFKKRIDNIYKKYFFNIHNKSHYSILESTIKINLLIKKAIKYKMKAIGIIDNNMMGMYEFINTINNINNNHKKNIIKAIIGIKILILNENNEYFNYYIIAKNKIGYYNLIKITSYSNIKYNNKNYINKKIVKKYSKGLIFLIGTLNTEISNNIINNKINKVKKILLYWKKIFNNDIYIEIFKNDNIYENKINKILIKLSKYYNIPYINQYESYYLEKKDFIIYKILYCIKNKININILKKEKNIYYKNKYYFKSFNKIKNKFKNYYKGFKNLRKLYKKIKVININKKFYLPNYKIPKNFYNKIKYLYNKKDINYIYLKYLIFKGAKKKYNKLNNIIIKRIKHELKIIKKKKFENYFLIVQDIIITSKKLKIYVGPGRGSVGGSIVAYCLNITKINPLKYNLIFERFLNVNRVKLPDIDIDIDDVGRKKIILYIFKKYGYYNVSNIITFNKFGSKLVIKDTFRVFNLPYKESNYISKLVIKNFTLKEILYKSLLFFKNKISNENFKKILKIKNIYNNKTNIVSKVLKIAINLEGLIKNTGIHACGIIISKDKIINHLPLMLNNKNKNILLTQYDTNDIEEIGLLKIDLLLLKTLNIIKNTLNNIIKNKKKIKFYIYNIKTYKLFKKGNIIGVFQYDSIKMIKVLRDLNPNKFEDLIALNSLYRPGTIRYLYNYINRKNGKEKINYDLKIIKEYLKETYGITIYQEQVILIAKKLSGINNYKADILREAIAKKKVKKLLLIKNNFFKKSLNNGYSINILNKIWQDWNNFSLYAFNKSHATCYTYITYQTAYLKTNYKLEYMCSLLSNNLQNYKKLINYIKESNKLKIKILPPNINKSKKKFSIVDNKKNIIIYGIEGIKSIGQKISNEIIKNKKYLNLLNFFKKINLKIINKKIINNLIISGSFDTFGIKRYLYFLKYNDKYNVINYIIKKVVNYKKNKKSINFNINKYFKNKIKITEKIKVYYICKQKKLLGVYLKETPLLYYKFEKLILNIKNTINNYNINYLFYGILNNINKKNNYYELILENDKLKKIKIYINNNIYIKYKKILKIYNIIVIKFNRYNIIYINTIYNIFKCYNININIYNKILLFNKILKFIKKKKQNNKYKKINIILYKKKKIFKKKTYNIKVNRKLLLHIIKFNKLIKFNFY